MHKSDRRFPGVDRGHKVEIIVDGQPVVAYAGETVAGALLASGRLPLRYTARRGDPRSVFCGIGVCFDCVMTIDGVPNVRTCRTPVRDGMRVETPRGIQTVREVDQGDNAGR